jgi:hypothetical protein
MVLLVAMLLCLWGAARDRMYKQAGGIRPSRFENVLLLSTIAGCVIFVFLIFQRSPEAAGTIASLIVVSVFGAWELYRWRIREKHPMGARVKVRPKTVRPSVVSTDGGEQRIRGVASMESEEQQIRAEVEKRKQRARQSGVITSAFKLYRDDLRHYEAWAKNCPELLHSAIEILDMKNTVGQGETVNRIEAIIRGNRYVFTFRERSIHMPDGEESGYGYLDVDFQGNRVMTINCESNDQEYRGRTWYTGDVSAFIEGPWIEELNLVFADVTNLNGEHTKKRQEQNRKKEIESLKKNFGL